MCNLNVKNSLHFEITETNNFPKCFDSMSNYTGKVGGEKGHTECIMCLNVLRLQKCGSFVVENIKSLFQFVIL